MASSRRPARSNERVAGGHVLPSRRERGATTLTEVAADELGPIIRAYLSASERQDEAVAEGRFEALSLLAEHGVHDDDGAIAHRERPSEERSSTAG